MNLGVDVIHTLDTSNVPLSSHSSCTVAGQGLVRLPHVPLPHAAASSDQGGTCAGNAKYQSSSSNWFNDKPWPSNVVELVGVHQVLSALQFHPDAEKGPSGHYCNQGVGARSCEGEESHNHGDGSETNLTPETTYSNCIKLIQTPRTLNLAARNSGSKE